MADGTLYRIDYTITRRRPDEEDFDEIGFGSSGSEESIDQAVHMLASALTHGEWETSGDMPSPESVMAEMEDDRG
jgi:hypothetical protein